ncbi:MAG: hypothetical protein NC453_16300 [Muribaculum sp.]|nr:hypothetical protein [Muribaculum sp.]
MSVTAMVKTRKRVVYFIMIALDGKHMNEGLLVKYDDFMSIAHSEWERFDDKQYFTTKLTDEQFSEFYNRAKPFNVMGK